MCSPFLQDTVGEQITENDVAVVIAGGEQVTCGRKGPAGGVGEVALEIGQFGLSFDIPKNNAIGRPHRQQRAVWRKGKHLFEASEPVANLAFQHPTGRVPKLNPGRGFHCQRIALGGECRRPSRSAPGPQGLTTEAPVQSPPRSRFPKNDFVALGDRQCFSVRGESQSVAPKRIVERTKLGDRLPACQIKDGHLFIKSSRGKEFPVWRESGGSDDRIGGTGTEDFIALAQLPKITPFETTQVLFAWFR